MSPTLQIPCRVDFRPAGSEQWCEWTGRVNYLSATGCSILTSHRPDPDVKLELRIYLPGCVWPVRVQDAEVVWSHWDEFTVEFHGLTISDQDQLQRCLAEGAVLEPA